MDDLANILALDGREDHLVAPRLVLRSRAVDLGISSRRLPAGILRHRSPSLVETTPGCDHKVLSARSRNTMPIRTGPIHTVPIHTGPIRTVPVRTGPITATGSQDHPN